MSEIRQPLLDVRGLCKIHAQGRWWEHKFLVRALDNVNLVLPANRTLALIGDSGAGKTTLAMCLTGLEQPDAGTILFEGKDITKIDRKKARGFPEIQLIFQNSTDALSPRMSALEIVEEPLLIRGSLARTECQQQALAAMEQVGIPGSCSNRLPHELSGGQRQRLAIARAIVSRPKLLILDEPLSGLDLSIQGQITNLLLDLKDAYQLSFLYISHNLELVCRIADEVAIMRRGKIVDQAAPAAILASSKRSHLPALVPSAPASSSRRGASAGA